MSSSSKSNSKRRMQSSASPKLPPEIQQQLNEAWNGAKASSKGDRIPLKRAEKVMKDFLGITVERSEFPSLQRQREKDTIDRETFFAIAGRKMVQKDKAMKAFALFDQHEKGVVVLEDLERIATELGEPFSVDEMQEIIAEVDQSGDGLLTSEDFIKIAQIVDL